jgi:hypothetical protein
MIQGADRLGVYNSAGTKVDVTDAEVATLDDLVFSVTTTATPASGTCGVQFVFKNADGSAIASKRAITAYLSDSAGAHVTAITSFAALTNGSISSLVAGKVIVATTTAAGLLGLTLTGSAATYYVTFILPNGQLLTSGALTINA